MYKSAWVVTSEVPTLIAERSRDCRQPGLDSARCSRCIDAGTTIQTRSVSSTCLLEVRKQHRFRFRENPLFSVRTDKSHDFGVPAVIAERSRDCRELGLVGGCCSRSTDAGTTVQTLDVSSTSSLEVGEQPEFGSIHSPPYRNAKFSTDQIFDTIESLTGRDGV